MAAGSLNGLVARARRAAQRRGQTPSTAHLLLVMLQGAGPEASLLSDQGVRESDLLSALKVVDPETSSTLDRTLERSQQIARDHGSEPNAVHLLLAITRDTRTAGHRSLQKMGTGPARVHARLLESLTGTTQEEVVGPRPVQATRDWGTTPRREPPVRPATGSSKPERPTSKAASPRPNVRRSARPAARRGDAPPPSRVAAQEAAAPASPPKSEGAAAAPSESRFHLDGRRFPLLSQIGRNLSALAADGALDPVIGRAGEIDQLLDVLARRRANNPVLVGPPGVGKTAIVEGLAQRLAEGEGALGDRILIEVSAGSMVKGTGVRGALAERIKILREEVTRSEGRVILFIDEIHGIVGGEGGPDDLAHELKAALARGELPCVGATTEREYRLRFEKDPALVRRFSAVRVAEPSLEACHAILEGIAPRYETHHGLPIAPEALAAAIELTSRYLSEGHLPDKAIGALDLAAARARRRGAARVDAAAVADVVGEQAGLPPERLLQKDGERLLQLEGLLAERVVGHEAIRSRVADALRKGAAGLKGRRPLGTFLFLGPTGVGKTLLAEALSEVFFPGSPMTRIDMSELGERHAVSRILGAPPGYVGHDAGGQLTESVRRRPHQLVLLDEIEKAHPDVLLALLALLDEGRLTDGKGRTVDFTKTIVVMTSNLGAHGPAPRESIGFGGRTGEARPDPGDRVLAAARSAMPPELWNRIDEPLVFAPLERVEVAEVARRMLEDLAERLALRGVELTWDSRAIEVLLDAGGFDPALGARPMRRVVGRLVEAPVANAMLEAGAVRSVHVAGKGGTVVVEAQRRGVELRAPAPALV